jgi:hypothetical protein
MVAGAGSPSAAVDSEKISRPLQLRGQRCSERMHVPPNLDAESGRPRPGLSKFVAVIDWDSPVSGHTCIYSALWLSRCGRLRAIIACRTGRAGRPRSPISPQQGDKVEPYARHTRTYRRSTAPMALPGVVPALPLLPAAAQFRSTAGITVLLAASLALATWCNGGRVWGLVVVPVRQRLQGRPRANRAQAGCSSSPKSLRRWAGQLAQRPWMRMAVAEKTDRLMPAAWGGPDEPVSGVSSPRLGSKGDCAMVGGSQRQGRGSSVIRYRLTSAGRRRSVATDRVPGLGASGCVSATIAPL